MARTTIVRYDKNPDVQAILGKQGDVYPRESLRWWQKIADGRLESPPLVEPATAGRFLRSIMDNPMTLPPVERLPPDDRSADTKDIAKSDAGREAAAMAMFEQAMQRGVAEGVRQVAAAGLLPLPSDRLLSMKQAKEETGLSESTIRRLPFVQESGVPGGRRKYKWSELQKTIALL